MNSLPARSLPEKRSHPMHSASQSTWGRNINTRFSQPTKSRFKAFRKQPLEFRWSTEGFRKIRSEFSGSMPHRNLARELFTWRKPARPTFNIPATREISSSSKCFDNSSSFWIHLNLNADCSSFNFRYIVVLSQRQFIAAIFGLFGVDSETLTS